MRGRYSSELLRFWRSVSSEMSCRVCRSYVLCIYVEGHLLSFCRSTWHHFCNLCLRVSPSCLWRGAQVIRSKTAEASVVRNMSSHVSDAGFLSNSGGKTTRNDASIELRHVGYHCRAPPSRHRFAVWLAVEVDLVTDLQTEGLACCECVALFHCTVQTRFG